MQERVANSLETDSERYVDGAVKNKGGKEGALPLPNCWHFHHAGTPTKQQLTFFANNMVSSDSR